MQRGRGAPAEVAEPALYEAAPEDVLLLSCRGSLRSLEALGQEVVTSLQGLRPDTLPVEEHQTVPKIFCKKNLKLWLQNPQTLNLTYPDIPVCGQDTVSTMPAFAEPQLVSRLLYTGEDLLRSVVRCDCSRPA